MDFSIGAVSADIPVPSTYSYEAAPVTTVERRTSGSPNFTAAKRNGQIVMNPYWASKTVHQDFLGSRTRHSWNSRNAAAACNGSCTPYYRGTELVESIWTEQGSMSYWSLVYPAMTVYGERLIDTSAIDRAIASTRTRVISDATSVFDVATTIAEGRETLSFLASTVDRAYRTMSTFRSVAKARGVPWEKFRSMNAKQARREADRAFRSAGNLWMEYRYALMPLIYTIQDGVRWFESRGVKFQSFKASEEVPVFTNPVRPLTGTYFEEEWSGTIKVTSHLKCKYDEGLKSFEWATLGLNPFATAWELIPYSFVADWIINIGDYIRACTSMDFSASSLGCTTVRTSLRKKVYLVDKGTDSYTWSYPSNVCTSGRSDRTGSRVFTRDSRSALSDTTFDTINRTLFTTSDAELTASVNLNWKRMVDSIVLMHRPISGYLKGLKA